MLSALGEMLPLAVGIAISPIPVIAAILMLLSPKARTTSIGFLAGWLLGIGVAVTCFTLLSSVIPDDDSNAAKPVVGVIQLVFGAGLLLLALRQWRSRPAAGDDAQLPKWMAAIDTMTPTRSFALGSLLAAVNPKNLLLGAGAGLALGTADITTGETIWVVLVFVLVAGASVLAPVLAYLLAARAMAGPLESLRVWLVRNNAAVMAVLLLVLAVVLIGKGIGNF